MIISVIVDSNKGSALISLLNFSIIARFKGHQVSQERQIFTLKIDTDRTKFITVNFIH